MKTLTLIVLKYANLQTCCHTLLLFLLQQIQHKKNNSRIFRENSLYLYYRAYLENSRVLEIIHTHEMCGKKNMTLFIFSRAPIFMDIVSEK